MTKRRHFIIAGIVFLLLVPIAMLTIDHPTAQRIAEHPPRTFFQEEFRHGIMLFEIFGHLIGVLLATVLIFLLDFRRRKYLVRFVGMAVASDLVAVFFKSLFVRFRPRLFYHDDFAGPAETVWQSFDGIEMLKTAFGNTASFPSGHSAVAWGLAVALAWLYPRGRGLFFFLAVMVMVQRVLCGAHFPSDTLAGAAIGMLVASLLITNQEQDAS